MLDTSKDSQDHLRLSKHQANIQRLLKQFNIPTKQEDGLLQESSHESFAASKAISEENFANFDSEQFKDRLKKITNQFSKYGGGGEERGQQDRPKENNKNFSNFSGKLNNSSSEDDSSWQEKVSKIRQKSKEHCRNSSKPKVDLDSILKKYGGGGGRNQTDESDDMFSRASQSKAERSPRIESILKKYRVERDSPEQQRVDEQNKSFEKLFSMTNQHQEHLRQSQDNLASSIDDLISKIKHRFLEGEQEEPKQSFVESYKTNILQESGKSFGSSFQKPLQETLKYSPMHLLKASKKSPMKQPSLDNSLNKSLRKSHEAVDIEEVVKNFPKSSENKNLVYDQFVREDVIQDKKIDAEVMVEKGESQLDEEPSKMEAKNQKNNQAVQNQEQEEAPVKQDVFGKQANQEQSQIKQEAILDSELKQQEDKIQEEYRTCHFPEEQNIEEEVTFVQEKPQKAYAEQTKARDNEKQKPKLPEPELKQAKPKQQIQQKVPTIQNSTPKKQPKPPTKVTSSQKKSQISVPKFDDFLSMQGVGTSNNDQFDLEYQRDFADIQDTLKTIKEMNLAGSPAKDLDSYLNEELAKNRADPIRQSTMSFGAGNEEGNQEIDYNLSSSDEEGFENKPSNNKNHSPLFEYLPHQEENKIQTDFATVRVHPEVENPHIQAPKRVEDIKESDISFQTSTEEDFCQTKAFDNSRLFVFSMTSMLSNGKYRTQELKEELDEKRRTLKFRDRELNSLIGVLPMAEQRLEQLKGEERREMLFQHLLKINYLLERHKFLTS